MINVTLYIVLLSDIHIQTYSITNRIHIGKNIDKDSRTRQNGATISQDRAFFYFFMQNT